MIELLGEEGTTEYEAAVSIAEAFESMWPGVSNSQTSQDHIKIAANVKISGYKISDIDVVICGVFNRERRFIPKKTIHDTSGKRLTREPITLQNFVVVIEVKDHPEGSVLITGDKISVKYSRGGKSGWKSATDQNIDQVHALHAYIKDLGQDAYVHRCVFMRGLTSVDIGSVITAGFSGVDFLTAIARTSRVNMSSKGYALSSGSNSNIQPILNSPIFRAITPSALDRRRMDMIVTSTPESNQLLAHLGREMITVRGHGGTGKTIMLLQAAWKAFEQSGKRTLVLTYNLALAADIRRLLALLNVPSDPETGGVVVETVMSFMYSWFNALQIINTTEDFNFDEYANNCSSALELLSAGAITITDIKGITEEFPDRFDFDCIMVDECQDWPQPEVDLLKSLYHLEKFCLADGIDQLLRGERANWDKTVPEEAKLQISLNRCLRMKRNLAVFANHLAIAGKINWRVVPNDLAGGGRIVILTKPYIEYERLHDDLVTAAKSKGNSEIDFLFCIPATDVIKDEGTKRTAIGDFLSQVGEIWNGVDDIKRKDFPRSKKQFRLVQYASCRGLEGWTVILEHADSYWEDNVRQRRLGGLTVNEQMAFEDIDQIAQRYAWFKIMISLTRPIDTLVISLKDLNSPFSKTILELAELDSDFVEIYH